MPIVQGAALIYPPGFCHFGNFLDETYFKQITSEYLIDETKNGRTKKVWKERSRENHFLDCRVGNLAAAYPYFTSFTPAAWADRARERGMPADLTTPDLFTPREFHKATAPALAPADSARAETGVPGVGSARDHFDALADVNRGVQ
jgi:phage terminase large subunit GpA-like protein